MAWLKGWHKASHLHGHRLKSWPTQWLLWLRQILVKCMGMNQIKNATWRYESRYIQIMKEDIFMLLIIDTVMVWNSAIALGKFKSVDVRRELQIRPWPLLSTSFSIHHSLTNHLTIWHLSIQLLNKQ
jgi:hypothetical protein